MRISVAADEDTGVARQVVEDAWFGADPSPDPGDAANVEHLTALERG